MASTIKLKNGSGAPTTGDLVQGEPALDLTNKRLYTEDAGGTVVEVGTSPSTIDINAGTIDDTVIGGTTPAAVTTTALVATTADINGGTIDGTVIGGSTAAAGSFTTGQFDTSVNVDGTVTADGLTVDGGATVNSNIFEVSSTTPSIRLTETDVTGENTQLLQASGSLRIRTASDDYGTTTERLRIDHGTGDISFYEDTGTTAKFYWDASAERLGIGTGGRIRIGEELDDSFNNDALLQIGSAAGDRAFIQMIVANDQKAAILFGDVDDDVTGSLEYQNADDSMRFAVNNNQEAVRIDSSRNLLVGVSSFSAGAGGGISMHPTTNGRTLLYCGTTVTSSSAVVAFVNPNGQVGTITTSSSATAYNTSSDERLKENITDAPAGNIDDIKVRSFDWKVDGSHQEYGMVAQELEAVAPYAVTKGETENDMWSVDYSKLVPMLIKEIQDLKAEVAALKGAN